MIRSNQPIKIKSLPMSAQGPDLDRRELLKGIAAATIVAGVGTTIPGLVTSAHAGTYGEGLVPPGIVHMRDQAAKEAYIQIIGLKNNRFDNDARLSKIFCDSTNFINYDQVNRSIAIVDPAVYVAAQVIALKAEQSRGSLYRGEIANYKPRQLEKINPSMNDLRLGLYAWFRYWGYGQKHSGFLQKTETNLSNAMFTPAYEDRATGLIKAKEFLDEQDLQKKTQFAQELTKQYMKMEGYDKTSLDPNNPFNKHMLAQTATSWLANHYAMESKSTKDNEYLTYFLINRNIEKPLRKYTHRVRGEYKKVKYFNKNL